MLRATAAEEVLFFCVTVQQGLTALVFTFLNTDLQFPSSRASSMKTKASTFFEKTKNLGKSAKSFLCVCASVCANCAGAAEMHGMTESDAAEGGGRLDDDEC
jgi:hypothetical protein